MQDFLWNIDLAIYQFFNQTLSVHWLDQAMPILTDLHYQTWFKILAPLALIFFFYKKFKRAGITYFIFLILALSVGDFVGGKVKRMVERPRPFQVAETQTIKKSSGGENRSFYSNHASNMFTMAAYISIFFPLAKIGLYGAAIFIALSRLHVGVHYPSDILVGAMMGIMWGWLFSYLAQYIVRKNQNKTHIGPSQNT